MICSHTTIADGPARLYLLYAGFTFASDDWAAMQMARRLRHNGQQLIAVGLSLEDSPFPDESQQAQAQCGLLEGGERGWQWRKGEGRWAQDLVANACGAVAGQ